MSALERERLLEEVLKDFKAVVFAIHSAAGPAWLELDLTLAQIKGLFSLACGGPMTISRVAETLGVGRPAASTLVDHLVTLGLADRAEDPLDRRRTFARLSPRGDELIAQLRQDRREGLLELLCQIADDDLAALAKGLGALATVASSPQRGRRSTGLVTGDNE